MEAFFQVKFLPCLSIFKHAWQKRNPIFTTYYRGNQWLSKVKTFCSDMSRLVAMSSYHPCTLGLSSKSCSSSLGEFGESPHLLISMAKSNDILRCMVMMQLHINTDNKIHLMNQMKIVLTRKENAPFILLFHKTTW